jgi:catechol 2,3-dioxygenase-like lactoylglutathione lyase family enzyme
MKLSPAISIIRVFSQEKTKEFYLDFLGFTLDWEHRFETNFPLYAQVSRSGLTLHLSEHHGDATPGSAIFVSTEDIDALHQELIAKNYAYVKPDIQDLPWGRVMEVADPFGNRIRFRETVSE